MSAQGWVQNRKYADFDLYYTLVFLKVSLICAHPVGTQVLLWLQLAQVNLLL